MPETLTGILQRELEQALRERLQTLYPDPAMLAQRRIVCSGAAPAVLQMAYPAAECLPVNVLIDRKPLGEALCDVLWTVGEVHETTVVQALGKPYSAATLQYARQRLAEGGVWLFTTLGPGTLESLRPLQAMSGMLDFSAWPTLIDLGNALTAAGFARPVLERDCLEVSYADPARALEDLQHDGWLTFGNETEAQTYAVWLERMQQMKEERDAETVTLTFDIVHGVAWKAAAISPAAAWQPVHFR